MDDCDAVLIAGATASGKSALAAKLSERTGRPIVNADALQVHADWQILTARPSAAEELRHAHFLYGHVPSGADYTVGTWLAELTALLEARARPIVVGGTGLYFRALTEGLAMIPATPPGIVGEAEHRLAHDGLSSLAADLSMDVRADLDLANPRRVLRAWTVARHTGRSIRDWQRDTPALHPAAGAVQRVGPPRRPGLAGPSDRAALSTR